jgi:hypothetical protein
MSHGDKLLERKGVALGGKIDLAGCHGGLRPERFFQIFHSLDLDHLDASAADGVIVNAAGPAGDDDFVLEACRIGKLLHLFRVAAGDAGKCGASDGACRA